MRIDFIIAGTVSSAIGGDIWINKGGIIYQQHIPQYTGIVLIIFGVFSFCVGLFSTTKKEVKYICPKCEKIVYLSEDESKLCDSCGMQLEPLEGFYERHPEKNK